MKFYNMIKQLLAVIAIAMCASNVIVAQDTVRIDISDIDIEAGVSTYDLTLTADNFKKLVSISYTLTWNEEDFQFVDIMYTHTALEFEFNTNLVEEGRLPVLWFDTFLNGKTIPQGDTLMTIRFELLSDACSGETFRFTDDPTRITFLDIDNAMPFTIEQGVVSNPVCLSTSSRAMDEESYSVFPNPSYGQVRVRSAQRIDLIELYDVTGLKLASFQNTDTFYFGGTGLHVVRVHTRKGVGQQRILLK